jgi:hypothetical protein
MEKINYKVIDNFLEKNLFNELKEILFSNKVAWFLLDSMTKNEKDSYFFNHCFYNHNKINSIFFDPFIVPILDKLECKSLIEARANLIFKKEKQYFSSFHIDRPFKCTTAILYLNSNNGYTILDEKEKIKIDCVENRMLIFDSDISHCGVSQTDEEKRLVINFNYF